jgi:hypothetical protein
MAILTQVMSIDAPPWSTVTAALRRVGPFFALIPMLPVGSIPILGASSHAPGLKGLSGAVNEI